MTTFAQPTDTADRPRSTGRQPRPWSPAHHHRAAAHTRRTAAIATGSLLALFGVARRDIPGLIVAGIGGALLAHGLRTSAPRPRAVTGGADHPAATGTRVSQAFTIDKPREELYRFWRNFENLPSIMTHLQSVEVRDDRRSHWVTEAPSIAGGSVEWDAEIVEDLPNELIAWRSLPGGDVDSTGCVWFEENPRGTVVRVEMHYVAPAGRLGALVAKLFGSGAERQIREDLRHFKCVMETGEIPTTEGQPRGTCLGRGKRQLS